MIKVHEPCDDCRPDISLAGEGDCSRCGWHQSEHRPFAPSNANTSGLEVMAWRWREKGTPMDWRFEGDAPNRQDLQWNETEPLVTAASAQARIAELEAELEEARTIDAGFWAWLGERDLQPDGPDVDWADIVVALTEHEINAYDLADKATERATAAEARADRLAKALARLTFLYETEHDADQIKRPDWLVEALQQETQP